MCVIVNNQERSMKFLFLIAVSVVVLAYPAKGQTCTCESNFVWVKKTFEENDAGFQYIIDNKGHAAYNIHNQLMLEKIKTARTLTECTELLSEWLKFFRSGHIGVQATTNNAFVSEKYKIDFSQFEKYISEKKEADFEGIWATGVSKIGIKKDGNNYVAFFMESELEARKPEDVLLRITPDGNSFKTISHHNIGDPKFIGKNNLQFEGMNIWKRLSPVFSEEPDFENYYKSVLSRNPYLEELNATTLYLRIPSFQIENKPAIDKLLADNKDIIMKTENLIIDLRNNGGGTSLSFNELLPFIYTNPIRQIGVEFLSTELNNKRSVEYSNNTNFDEKTRQWYKSNYDKLQRKLGEFVNLSGNEVSISQYDTIYEYPKNVGIIIDRGCASATEHFLLNAKQSKKVKLFGTSTYGMLDIANTYYVESPCKEFTLTYGLSRNLGLSEMAFDDIGIQPDFFIDKTIPQHKWVEFVNEILNQ